MTKLLVADSLQMAAYLVDLFELDHAEWTPVSLGASLGGMKVEKAVVDLSRVRFMSPREWDQTQRWIDEVLKLRTPNIHYFG